jgi:hypothetical protein
MSFQKPSCEILQHVPDGDVWVAGEPVGQGAGVRVGVQRDDPVAAVFGEHEAEAGGDRGLADPALEVQADGDVVGRGEGPADGVLLIAAAAFGLAGPEVHPATGGVTARKSWSRSPPSSTTARARPSAGPLLASTWRNCRPDHRHPSWRAADTRAVRRGRSGRCQDERRGGHTPARPGAAVGWPRDRVQAGNGARDDARTRAAARRGGHSSRRAPGSSATSTCRTRRPCNAPSTVRSSART